MSDVDDASADASRGSCDFVKPIEHISSQKILEKLELITSEYYEIKFDDQERAY